MIGLWLAVIAFVAVVGGFLWPYTINSWLVYTGKPPSVEFWHGALLGLVPGIGQSCIPAAVLTWIAFLFIS